MKADAVVDARYKSCPGPLLALVNTVMRSKPGQVIELLATDPAAPNDVKAWASHVGHRVIKVEKENDTYHIYLEVLG
ncbi:MAG: sulfurtransferase TusA family protein [Sulfolobales archaeon]|nr:sulfurtransferase TusA family protein [Sulfolobales archaeon]MCX8186813.1 sulfurtransferase TusA family protein [Sulfolobales archaeon]MDW7969854.1 sulfurtransferase TusA family protein [Sulfolobales archaeon]